jgi:hypothetical protein
LEWRAPVHRLGLVVVLIPAHGASFSSFPVASPSRSPSSDPPDLSNRASVPSMMSAEQKKSFSQRAAEEQRICPVAGSEDRGKMLQPRVV